MSNLEFNPQKSRVQPESLSDFLNRELTGDFTIDKIPGVGPATIEILKNCKFTIDSPNGETVVVNGITSTFGLIGVYLSFKNGVDENGNPVIVGPVEHTNRFYLWWCSLGTPAGFRAGVIHSICEKVNISFPGIYDSTQFVNDEEI